MPRFFTTFTPPRSVTRRTTGFSLVEAIFTIAIIGIMSSLVIAAISNASRDTHRIVGRQQQATVQNALTAWVMAQTRVTTASSPNVGQYLSLESVRAIYNTQGTTKARFNLLVPNPQAPATDFNARAGYLDSSTADHILSLSPSSDRLKTSALENTRQHLELPEWQSGDYPRVNLNND